MKIKESRPFKEQLKACERIFGKGKMGWVHTPNPLPAGVVEKHAQEIYNSLTGCGLTYYDTVMIREIVWDQLRIDRDSKTL